MVTVSVAADIAASVVVLSASKDFIKSWISCTLFSKWSILLKVTSSDSFQQFHRWLGSLG